MRKKSAQDRAGIQIGDESARVGVEAIAAGVKNWKYEELPSATNRTEIRRLVEQGELLLLPGPRKLLLRRLTKEPRERLDRNLEKYERLLLLGVGPRKISVPMLMIPWVLNFAYKEAIHLGDNEP